MGKEGSPLHGDSLRQAGRQRLTYISFRLEEVREELRRLNEERKTLLERMARDKAGAAGEP